jgi:predicted  nucleic acid-binding Zn-ribbon protein
MAQTIRKQKCKRCGHDWYPESEKLPKYCPKCKSPYWNKERRSGQTVAQKLETLAGEIHNLVDNIDDPGAKFTAETIMNAWLSDNPQQSRIADLIYAKAEIEKTIKEHRERDEYNKQCAIKFDQIAGDVRQLAKDTEQAAVIQEVERVLDLIMKLPADFALQRVTEYRKNIEKATEQYREIIAKNRTQQVLQLKLEVRE